MWVCFGRDLAHATGGKKTQRCTAHCLAERSVTTGSHGRNEYKNMFPNSFNLWILTDVQLLKWLALVLMVYSGTCCKLPSLTSPTDPHRWRWFRLFDVIMVWTESLGFLTLLRWNVSDLIRAVVAQEKDRKVVSSDHMTATEPRMGYCIRRLLMVSLCLDWVLGHCSE